MPTRRSAFHTLLDALAFNAQVTSRNSDAVDCEGYRKFALYLEMLSAGVPTTIQFIPQFIDDEGNWFDHLQGLFASLYYEDTVMTSVIREVFHGEVVGDSFRLRAVAVGSDATNTFTITAKVRFQD